MRAPSIIRSPDGKKFYQLATDLRIANGKGWGADNADLDGDGATNAQEFAAGTLPRDCSSVFRMTAAQQTGTTVQCCRRAAALLPRRDSAVTVEVSSSVLHATRIL